MVCSFACSLLFHSPVICLFLLANYVEQIHRKLPYWKMFVLACMAAALQLICKFLFFQSYIMTIVCQSGLMQPVLLCKIGCRFVLTATSNVLMKGPFKMEMLRPFSCSLVFQSNGFLYVGWLVQSPVWQ